MKSIPLLFIGGVLLGVWFWNELPDRDADPIGVPPGLQPESDSAIRDQLDTSSHALPDRAPASEFPSRSIAPITAPFDPETGEENRPIQTQPKEPYDLSDNKVTRPKPGTYEGAHIEEFYPNGQHRFVAAQKKSRSGQWQLDGRWSCWYENGQRMELGSYSNDMESGAWQWWYSNGENQATGQFVGGNKEGAWTYWYANGTKMSDAFYEDGVGSGTWTLYHDDGTRKAHGSYHDGVIAGRWMVWDEFGEVNPLRSGYYENGVRVSD